MKKKVLLAMSGGIDSSAAAVILIEQGYEVTGYTFRIDGVTSDSVEGASKICKILNIHHIYTNITDQFNRKVIQYFKHEYENGRTPNPCIRCNRDIKFGLIYNYAKKNGYDYAATGHYASIIEQHGSFYLGISIDATRDQTYFLYVLKEHQLKHILFPLNGITKLKAREICETAGLMPADSKESREICFVPNDYKSYLVKKLGTKTNKGNFIDSSGNILGSHNGIQNYTIGQRKGLGIHLGKPGYVLSIDSCSANIVLGDEASLYTNHIVVGEISLINDQIPKSDNLYVKIRYSTALAHIKSINIENNKMMICSNEALRAVTPGQSAVIYNNNIVVGGGVIL